MIKLHRKPISASVEEAVLVREARYLSLLSANQAVPASLDDSYREAAFKAHLLAETHGKCAYCECKLTHAYPGDVEHILAKKTNPQKRLSYDNLTIVCWVCNHEKLDYDNKQWPLLNPFVDNPDEELYGSGFWVFPYPAKDRARITIERVKLNRKDLLDRREERLNYLRSLATEYVRTPDGPIKELAANELVRQAKDDQEYALIVRAFLRQIGVAFVAA